MDILIKTTRISSWKNKDQKGDSFRTDEKKVKNIIPRMGWFHASGTVEINYVRRPFITWWYKEGQVDWWIKLHKLYAFKDNNKKASYLLVLQSNKESLSFILNLWLPTIYLQINLFRISKVTQTSFMTCRVKWRDHLKK